MWTGEIMDKEKFRLLISSKGFSEELHYKLLKIADSSMVIEDMLDLMKELESESDYQTYR